MTPARTGNLVSSRTITIHSSEIKGMRKYCKHAKIQAAEKNAVIALKSTELQHEKTCLWGI